MTGQRQLVRLDTKNGWTIGDLNNAPATVDIICLNSIGQNETALQFVMNVEVHLNGTISKFVAYPTINKINKSTINKTIDNVGINSANLQDQISIVFETYKDFFNSKYSKGAPLAMFD
jgi:hypothetical protein